jgi:CheY-like chemotaxis protein
MVNELKNPTISVLVVEDEPIIRMYIVSEIEDVGFKVFEAGNADEAIKILERNIERLRIQLAAESRENRPVQPEDTGRSRSRREPWGNTGSSSRS